MSEGWGDYCRKFCVEIFCLAMSLSILEALSVNDGWTTLVVVLLGDPHLLEG